MAKIYLRYALKNKVYRADARDLGLNPLLPPHDVVVLSVNKRRKTCKVKTITSLEFETRDRNGNLKWSFINKKLPDVRSGKITVIPQNEINTKHLSGIHNDVLTIKTKKMYLSHSGATFPRRYKQIIKKKK